MNSRNNLQKVYQLDPGKLNRVLCDQEKGVCEINAEKPIQKKNKKSNLKRTFSLQIIKQESKLKRIRKGLSKSFKDGLGRKKEALICTIKNYH